MKKIVNIVICLLCLFATSISFAAPIQTEQASVRGLTLASNIESVKKVMGEPFRVGHFYMENYWGGYSDIMYEYPGVNFVFSTKSSKYPLIKIILDSPQATMDNGLKVGVSSNTVVNTFGRDYDFSNSEMVYDYVTDPISYNIGKISFQLAGGAVKKIMIEVRKNE